MSEKNPDRSLWEVAAELEVQGALASPGADYERAWRVAQRMLGWVPGTDDEAWRGQVARLTDRLLQLEAADRQAPSEVEHACG